MEMLTTPRWRARKIWLREGLADEPKVGRGYVIVLWVGLARVFTAEFSQDLGAIGLISEKKILDGDGGVVLLEFSRLYGENMCISEQKRMGFCYTEEYYGRISTGRDRDVCFPSKYGYKHNEYIYTQTCQAQSH